jgi:hypothetical protein
VVKKLRDPVAEPFEMTIDVPAFDEKAAYNDQRPISGLVRSQLLHLHQVENLSLAPGRRTGVNINDLHTELDASNYIRKVTALVHRHSKAQAGTATAARKRPKKTTARRAKKAVKKRATQVAQNRRRRRGAQAHKSKK